MRVSSVFYPLLKDRIYGPIGRAIDILAILGTLFGVAVSIGLGTSQIGAGLVGVMYVLDEPSIGLHQRDNERLLGTLTRLRDLGNTGIVVEHDEDAIRLADYVLDIGPGAGVHGGEIVGQGTLQDILEAPRSLTGQYLAGRRSIPLPASRRPASGREITIHGATENNLKDVSVDLPKRRLTVFTGVSGSGKSSLVFGTIASESRRLIDETYSAFLQGFMPSLARPDVDHLEGLTTAIIVDQERMGANPRSTVGTATDASAMLRILYSRLGQPHVGPPTAFSPDRRWPTKVPNIIMRATQKNRMS